MNGQLKIILRVERPEPGVVRQPCYCLGFYRTLVNLPEAKLARAPFPALPGLRSTCSSLQYYKVWSRPYFLNMAGVQFSIDHWLDGNAGASFCCCSQVVRLIIVSLDSWFMPQIRKYRRSLIEVLLASWFAIAKSCAAIGVATDF